MDTTRPKADLLARIAADREHWRQLVAAVGADRMNQPGPMGAWTFKDLAAHLTFWQEWFIARLEAGPGGAVPLTWPPDLTPCDPDNSEQTDWDAINTWVREQHRTRLLHDVLADADTIYDRLTATIAALPDEDITTPGRYTWLHNQALADANFAGHLRNEHEPSLRSWLITQQA